MDKRAHIHEFTPGTQHLLTVRTTPRQALGERTYLKKCVSKKHNMVIRSGIFPEARKLLTHMGGRMDGQKPTVVGLLDITHLAPSHAGPAKHDRLSFQITSQQT
jgi:hypothetical protein